MKSLIAGVSLITASVVCILAFALVDHRFLGSDFPFALAWFAYYIPGLCFLVLAFFVRDKPGS